MPFIPQRILLSPQFSVIVPSFLGKNKMLCLQSAVALFLLVLPAPVIAQAQSYISDAFGLAPQESVENTPRALWSGVRENFTPQGYMTQSNIPPLPPDALFLLIGSKSVVAGKGKVHTVALGFDRLGNLIADGQDGIFDLGGTKVVHKTRHGLVDHYFTPEPQVGLFYVGAQVGGSQSARAEYRVTPNFKDIALMIAPLPDMLTGESFVTTKAQTGIDAFGNATGNGALVQFIIHHADGSVSLSQNITVADSADGHFITRDMAASGTISAHLLSAQSPPLPFNIKPMQAPSKPRIIAQRLASIGAIEMRIGPFTTDAGYVLNDGAQISGQFISQKGNVQNFQGWLQNGMLNVTLAASDNDLPATIKLQSIEGDALLTLSEFKNFDFYKSPAIP